jgi:uncharacterized membrane protein
MALIMIVRWIHVIAAAAWLGEVVAVVFVLAPASARLTGTDRAAFISRVFPLVFRLASALAVITLLAGAALNFLLTRWQNLGSYAATLRGGAIILGGSLGLLLAVFHFVVEARLESRVQSLLGAGDETAVNRVTRFLTLVPRVGLAVLLAVFILMMIGARGV